MRRRLQYLGACVRVLFSSVFWKTVGPVASSVFRTHVELQFPEFRSKNRKDPQPTGELAMPPVDLDRYTWGVTEKGNAAMSYREE